MNSENAALSELDQHLLQGQLASATADQRRQVLLPPAASTLLVMQSAGPGRCSKLPAQDGTLDNDVVNRNDQELETKMKVNVSSAVPHRYFLSAQSPLRSTMLR
jgi:hypothetical protein